MKTEDMVGKEEREWHSCVLLYQSHNKSEKEKNELGLS